MIFASVCKISSLFRNRVTQKSLDFYVFSINIVEICKKPRKRLIWHLRGVLFLFLYEITEFY